MTSPTLEQVRSEVRDCLEGRTTLREFWSRMVLVSFDQDGDEPAELKDLVYGISLRMSEYTSGYWTEAELREKLAELIK